MPLKTSVIIVSYNSEDFIEKCLNSLLKNISDNCEVIVIDNNSTDQTVNKLKKFLPKITLIESNENLGFSKGNNLASKKAKGEYLFFLNPDTEMLEPVLNKLIDFSNSKEDIGIVAPKLVMPNGKSQESVRKLPTLWGAIKEYIFNIKHTFSQYAPKEEYPTQVETVYGAAFLIKRDLFNQIGGFDEKYFLYYEDIDLCNKIQKLGKKIYYYPKAAIKHLVGATYSEVDRFKLNYESLTKYHGRFTAFLLQIIFQLYRVMRHIRS